jgi:hypothetical protein
MNTVIDPPKTVLPPQAEPSMPVEPEQGVIEEARRRQQRRWASIAVTFAALVVILIAARFASGAGGVRHGAAASIKPTASRAERAATKVEPVRLAPALEAGELGWADEERLGGGFRAGCCSLLNHTAEVEGWGQQTGPHSWSTANVFTISGVAAVSFEGRKPVPTRSDGLPFGLRFAVARVRHQGTAPVALDARGQRIPMRGFGTFPKRHSFEGPYAPRRWRAPQAPPSGACELSVSTMAGLRAAGGAVVPELKGYRVLDSRAFQSCADTAYTLNGSLLIAAVLLDAEHPGSTPGPLPDMTPVRGAAGLFETPGTQLEVSLILLRRLGLTGAELRPAEIQPAVLTAKRVPGAWLVVADGTSSAQRIEVLRRLRATVHP